jgi:hypothetical protein
MWVKIARRRSDSSYDVVIMPEVRRICNREPQPAPCRVGHIYTEACLARVAFRFFHINHVVLVIGMACACEVTDLEMRLG